MRAQVYGLAEQVVVEQVAGGWEEEGVGVKGWGEREVGVVDVVH
jgi:hypothetical protein